MDVVFPHRRDVLTHDEIQYLCDSEAALRVIGKSSVVSASLRWSSASALGTRLEQLAHCLDTLAGNSYRVRVAGAHVWPIVIAILVWVLWRLLWRPLGVIVLCAYLVAFVMLFRDCAITSLWWQEGRPVRIWRESTRWRAFQTWLDTAYGL